MTAGIQDVRKDHRWTAKNIVFQNASGIYGHIVLDLYIVADNDLRRNDDILADVTTRTNSAVFHDMREMPDLSPGKNHTRFVDVGRFVDKDVFPLHLALRIHSAATALPNTASTCTGSPIN